MKFNIIKERYKCLNINPHDSILLYVDTIQNIRNERQNNETSTSLFVQPIVNVVFSVDVSERVKHDCNIK